MLENMGKARDYSQLYDSFTYISFTTLSRKKAEDVDPVRKDMVKAIRDEVKKSIADLKKTLFPISPEDMLADMSVCQKAVDELVTLTLSFKERLDAAKRDKNLVDFSDMEHFALEILLDKDDNGELKPRETALELQDYFEEIMIDEYQDSNEVQELLLRSISGEDKGHYNRFMVGDVKQSIYKFRLARPEIFMEKYDTYKTGEAAKDRVRIDLSRNFRSRREVTEATNFLCGQLMAKEVGNVEYDENAVLYAGASYVEPQDAGQYATELLIATDSEDESQPMTEKEKEAVMVAERIQELVGHFPVTDVSYPAPARTTIFQFFSSIQHLCINNITTDNDSISIFHCIQQLCFIGIFLQQSKLISGCFDFFTDTVYSNFGKRFFSSYKYFHNLSVSFKKIHHRLHRPTHYIQ